MQMAGKVCLVTGGTRGIGAASAVEYAARGADVAIVGRALDEEAQSAASAVERHGRRCRMIAGDMGKAEDCASCVEQTVAALGRLDVLVHSAGGPVPGSLMEITPETYYAAFDVHVHAVFHLCRAAIPHIRKQGEGAIILVSSSAGLRGCLGAGAYGVVKGALIQYTRVLAREHANDNIRVNCVAPGVIRTRFHAAMTPETYQNNIDNRIPLHREGTSEQVAQVIALMTENDFITGETYTIDGGLTMRIA